MKLKRLIFLILGFLCLGLGCVGVALPILPTVPFFLVTVFLFLPKFSPQKTPRLVCEQLSFTKNIWSLL